METPVDLTYKTLVLTIKPSRISTKVELRCRVEAESVYGGGEFPSFCGCAPPEWCRCGRFGDHHEVRCLHFITHHNLGETCSNMAMKHDNKSTTSLTQFIRGIGLKLRVKPNRAAPAGLKLDPSFWGVFCNSELTTGISLVVPAVCSAARQTIRLPCWPPFRFSFLAFVTIATIIVCP